MRKEYQDDDVHLNDVGLELRARQSQQEAIVEISRQALHSSDIDLLIHETIELVVKALDVDYCEFLELLPGGKQLLLKMGIGWQPGYVGRATVDAGLGSQAGFTLQAGKPVIVTDLLSDQRFTAPTLLTDHKVISGMTVIIPGRERPYGILGVHSRTLRTFSTHDSNFLQNIANLFALAIHRHAVELFLRSSRDQLAVILEGIGEGITVQATDGRLVYANDMAAHLLGYATREALVDAPISEIMQKFEVFDEQGESFPLERLPGRRALQGEENITEIIRFRITETGAERWSIVSASPVKSSLHQVEFAVNIFQDITDLKSDEQNQRFLAEASAMLAGSMDYQTVLNNIAKMAVTRFADWCSIHLLEENGSIKRLGVAHKNPAKIVLLQELEKKYPPNPDLGRGVYKVLHSGQAEYYPEIPEASLEKLAIDKEHLEIIRSLGLHSAMIIPLVARGRTLGALTLVWAESRRRYGEREIFLGKELAQRAAMTIDNIHLFQEASSLNTELEAKVAKRTVQLERTIARLNAEIAERKKAEKDLQKNKVLFSDLFELSPDAIFLVDQQGRIVQVNTQGEAVFGYDRADLLGKPIDMLLSENIRAVHAGNGENYQLLPQRQSMGAGLEGYGQRKTGEKFPVDVMLSPVKVEEEWLVISVVRDVTEQKRTQSELAEVQHRLLDSKESERLRLAQELHDGIIQELFSITFQLAELEKDFSKNGEVEFKKNLRASRDMTQQVIRGLRNLSRELRPPALAPFGLEQAILSHIEQFQEMYPDITVHTDLNPDGQILDERLRLALFRIYQHSVSNVARHAKAKHLWVRLELTEQEIILEIEDDGKGFEIPSRWVEMARQGHLGLVGTRERVQAIGGQLKITSTLGKGTLIRVTAQKAWTDKKTTAPLSSIS